MRIFCQKGLSSITLTMVLSVNVTSVLDCLTSSVRYSPIMPPQWAMVSGQGDRKLLQCRLFSFLPELQWETPGLNVWETIENNSAPFCRIYFTQGFSCESNKQYGWKTPLTLTWSSDLDTWIICNNVVDNGGWTVIQRRTHGNVDFNRDWRAYKLGFGSLYGDYWIGMESIHRLVVSKPYRIRFDITSKARNHYYAEYEYFSITNESDFYRLSIGSYSGNIGDSLSEHNGYPFQTVDMDLSSDLNCPIRQEGGWWYLYKTMCHTTNLNGKYDAGMTWKNISELGESLIYTEMKIRPVSLTPRSIFKESIR